MRSFEQLYGIDRMDSWIGVSVALSFFYLGLCIESSVHYTALMNKNCGLARIDEDDDNVGPHRKPKP